MRNDKKITSLYRKNKKTRVLYKSADLSQLCSDAWCLSGSPATTLKLDQMILDIQLAIKFFSTFHIYTEICVYEPF